jgi:hypothetical protein
MGKISHAIYVLIKKPLIDAVKKNVKNFKKNLYNYDENLMTHKLLYRNLEERTSHYKYVY